MCHFITMIFPPTTNFKEISSVLSRHHRHGEIVINPHMTLMLRPGELYVQPAPKVCDCGTSLGSLRPRPETKRPERSAVDALRRKGWSDSKITRCLAQRQETYTRKAKREADRHLHASGTDPDGWVSTTSDILALFAVDYVGLLLHWYSGRVDNERIQIDRRTKLLLGEGLADALYHVEEDIVYEIHRK